MLSFGLRSRDDFQRRYQVAGLIVKRVFPALYASDHPAVIVCGESPQNFRQLVGCLPDPAAM